jgi:hypothetical protein
MLFVEDPFKYLAPNMANIDCCTLPQNLRKAFGFRTGLKSSTVD